MLVLTNKDRQKRWNELNQPEIDSLMKKASKEGKGGSTQYRLYRKYGIEGDFDYQGGDWGHERSHNE